MNKKKGIFDSGWNFEEADTKEYTHGFHSYPAMMIPQIARRLIQEYGKNAESVLDPFMGSGSSLVEAVLHDTTKKVYGLEINPLATLIAKVKTTRLNPELLQKEFLILKNKIPRTVESSKPNFFNIDFWFKPSVIQNLNKIKTCIGGIEDKDFQDFFKLCFSETVRKVSNTRNSEFKLYRMSEDKLREFDPDVFETFENIVLKNITRMDAFYNKSKNKNFQVNILKEDTRKKTSIPDKECDFLVTSPPYGDSRTTVAYGQFTRLSSHWLDYDSAEVKEMDKKGLGGIPTKDLINNLNSETLKEVLNQIKEKDEKRAKDVLAFYTDFDKCTEEINRIMKSRSFLCFVVGNRTVKKVKIPTDEIIAELFINKFGYVHHKTIIREIPNKKMPKANSPTNKKGELVSTMNHEYIVILEKP